MHKAVKNGDVELVAQLLESNPSSINEVNKSGQTPLHAACHAGDSELVLLLLEKGASTSVKDKNGDTPLFKALESGCEVEVIHALASKSDLKITNKDQLNPLMYACSVSDELVVAALLDFKHTLTYVHPSSGQNVLHFAVLGGIEILQVLLKSGKFSALLNAVDNKGRTPAHYANPEMIAMLQEAGADLSIRDSEGVLCTDALEEVVEYSYVDKPVEEQGTKPAEQSNTITTQTTQTTTQKYADVAEWLEAHKLGHLVIPFKRGKVTLKQLPTLTRKELGRLGLEQADKEKVVALIEANPSDFPTTTSTKTTLTLVLLFLLVLPMLFGAIALLLGEKSPQEL